LLSFGAESFVIQFDKIHRTILLFVVSCGCETLLLTLREEFRLRLFENGVLRRMFVPNRDKVTAENTTY
jgi:hypothetical protein